MSKTHDETPRFEELAFAVLGFPPPAPAEPLEEWVAYFAGGGVYAQDIRILAEQYEEVEYLGVISASDAAALVAEHWWALLPIDDEVTRYAFPSKSSGYALAGAAVAAICGDETSVARWVKREGVGLVCPPHKSALVRFFSELEDICIEKFGASDQLKKRLAISSFSASLREVADKLSSA